MLMATSYEKEVKKFIKEQLRKGYFKEEIIDHLVSHGHSQADINRIIDEAVQEGEVEIEKEPKYSKTIAIAIGVVILGILIVFSGAATKASGSAILLGYLPSILVLIYTAIAVDNAGLRKYINFMPLLLAVIFFAFVSAGTLEVTKGMDAIKLSVLNLVLGYAIAFGIAKSANIREEKPQYMEQEGGKTEEGEEPREEPKEDIVKTLGAIEDKCKAINFVIGRVYQARNGATKEMREKLKIPPEYYNELDEARRGGDKKKIIEYTEKIEKILEFLQNSEHEAFGRIRLVNLKRDSHGNDKIIDVLANNDEDPVRAYYEEALDIIRSLKKTL